MNISVVGLGKLGLSMAMAITHKGHHVIGVDISQSTVAILKQGQSTIREPFVQEYLTEALDQKLFIATDNVTHAIHNSDLTLVAVNSLEREDGAMDLDQISTACQMISKTLKEKNNFHVVAINSTIVPETTDRLLKPICEKSSGKKMGEDFGLCVNPVWIALTTVVRDFFSPPVLVIGESDRRSGDLLAQFYVALCGESIPILRTSPLMAEIIKMAHNAFATTKMAFMNEVADACTLIPGADVRVLAQFFQLGGERAGQFLQAGTGFGGPCFPRDLQFFTRYVKEQIKNSPLLEAISVANEEHAIRIVEMVERELGSLRNSRIAILGLGYKPGSHITERSSALRLTELLLTKGAEVTAYDPNVKELSVSAKQGHFHLSHNIEEALQNVECCIIATPWDALKLMDGRFFKRWMKRTVLVDLWRIYEGKNFSQSLERYISLGLGSAQAGVSEPVVASCTG